MKVTGGFNKTLEFLHYEILMTIKNFAKKKKSSPHYYRKNNQKSRFMRTKVKIRVISEEGTGGKKYKNLACEQTCAMMTI